MPAPNFTLASDDTGETVSLESLRGTPVVVYFYPKDDTPGSFFSRTSLVNRSIVLSPAAAFPASISGCP